jgi:hypothetical protein
MMRPFSRGQTAVLIALVIPVLVGATALGTDIAVEYYNWVQMQKSADAAVLAGANYLPDNPTTAVTAAQQFAQSNGVKASEITSTTVGALNQSITMQMQRTVPYYFAKVLGLSSGTITVSAQAGPQYPPNTVNATSPSQVPPGGDNNGNNGTYCASTGACDVIPIGLNSSTTYSDGTQIVLQQGQLGPGNWDLLALGGVGGNNLRTNIANGYNGMVSVGDNVTTEPGKKVGPIDQGFQDRLNLAATMDPTGVWGNHKLNNPRVMVLPVVDWSQGVHGRTTVPVTAFATVWLDSYNGGQVTVHMISQVIAKSFGSANAPYFGSRGSPKLLR